MNLHFILHTKDDLWPGLRRIAPKLGVAISEGGITVALRRADCFAVSRTGDTGEIVYRQKVEAFRGLSLLCEHWQQGDFTIAETSRFETCGIMIDCSRNAVAKPQTVEDFQCKMALMGANRLMLYTEDTYEVKEQPYFGYLRGRYTQQELRQMDDAADMLGIEMIPCIQTLGHLERMLQWRRPFDTVRDTESVLFVGKEETYCLLEEMIVAASAPFRSHRIHIGMDEAYGLGMGQRLFENGYFSSTELMRIHLEEVGKILDKHGLEAMMWSDMFFHASEPGEGVYIPGTKLTEEVLAQVPKDITQVYWHYYSETEDNYDEMLSQHERMPGKTAFAGALWSWNGPATDYRKAMAVTLPALRQCEKHRVEDVFVTAWLDDAAEANIESFLLGMQIYCEYNYTGCVDMAHIEERFEICAGASAQAFYNISKLNVLPGMPLQKYALTSVAKALLYEDPLIPMCEADFENLLDESYFWQLAKEYSGYARQYTQYARMFTFYGELAKTVALKCVWHNGAASAVRTRDMAQVERLMALAEDIIAQLGSLSLVWSELWYADNKPYGYEVIDIRVGGCIQRFRSAKRRLSDFAEGLIADIEELTCEKLPYLRNSDNEIDAGSSWARIASASRIV